MAPRPRRVVLRVALVVLAVNSLMVGLWAELFPRSFYDDFPGLGRHWIVVDGPFNEHLIRDVGGLNPALAAVTVGALITLGRTVVLVTGVAWLLYGVPHLVYHASHAHELGASDAAAITISLAGSVIMAIVVLVLAPPGLSHESAS